MHMNKLETLYKSYLIKKKSGVKWGHRGQIKIFTKNVLTPPYNIVYSWDSCMCISLSHSTKCIGSEVNLGSFAVTRSTGVKKVIFTKKVSARLHYISWSRD